MGFSFKNWFTSKTSDHDQDSFHSDFFFRVKASGDELDKEIINQVMDMLPTAIFSVESDYYMLPINCDYGIEGYESLPEEFEIVYWYKKPGEYINKGDLICVLSLTSHKCYIHVESNIEGYFNPHIQISNQFISDELTHMNNILLCEEEDDEDFLHNRIFGIYDELTYQDNKEEIESKKFNVGASVEKDDFTKKFNIFCTIDYGIPLISNDILWDTLSYTNPIETVYNHQWGFILINKIEDFYLDFYIQCDSNENYITFKFSNNKNKLVRGSQVLFLFDDDTVLTFDLNSINKEEQSVLDKRHVMYNTSKVLIKNPDLFILSSKRLVKWRVIISDNKSPIEGDISNQESQSNVMQLFSEHLSLFKNNVSDDDINETIQKEEKCHVYLMHDTSNNMYKIGVSNSPVYREKTLQSEKPTIEMLSSKPFVSRKMAMTLEKSLHENYKEKRIRGEWFELTPTDVSDITDMLN